MNLYCLVDSQNAILASSLCEKIEDARKEFQVLYANLDVHDINKDIVKKYQDGLCIYKICLIDFEKFKVKKYFKKEGMLFE